jgi:hypothetical protein
MHTTRLLWQQMVIFNVAFVTNQQIIYYIMIKEFVKYAFCSIRYIKFYQIFKKSHLNHVL